MNKQILLVTMLALTVSGNAFGYTSGQSSPVDGAEEREYRVIVKSATAGFSDAVAKGNLLKLDTINSNDGYTVTRVGANNVATTNLITCIAEKAIATGTDSQVRCISKGYVDFVTYDASGGFGIRAGQKLCMSAAGLAIPCAACDAGTPGFVNDCRLGTATQNSPITSLEAKASGTGSDLKVYINAR